MVCKLADYGEVAPGRQALWALLEYVSSQAGVDVQQRIDKLRPLIDLRSPLALGFAQSQSSAPTDTSSGVETPDIDVLVQNVRSRLHDKIQRLHGTMQLLDVARPVEIDRLYVDVNILTEPTSYSRLEINDLLSIRDLSGEFDRFNLFQKRERVAGLKAVVDYPKLMMLGKPGAGKTTFLQHLVIECNNGNLLADRVPIFIKLRDFVRKAKKTGDFSLKHHISSYLQGCTQSKIEALLTTGKVLLLLDGLDEVPEVDDNAVVDEIEEFIDNYDQNQLIITCRIKAQKYKFNCFTYVEVADFNWEQIAAFSRKWFVATARNEKQEGEAKAEWFLEKLNLPENNRIRELAVTPILLSLTCKVFDNKGKFYSKPAELYEQGLEILLSQWDESRGIKRDQVYRALSVGQKQSLLSYVAARKFEQEQYVLFGQAEIQEYIAGFLSTSLEDSQVVLESIESQHGLLIERARRIYSFSHLTFQEYFTAKEIFTVITDTDLTTTTLRDVARRIHKPQWIEVFSLVANMRWNDNLLHQFYSKIAAIIDLDEKINKFLIWVNQKSISLHAPFKIASVRAFYFALELGYENTFDLAYLVDRNLGYAHDFGIALDLALIRNFQFNLSTFFGTRLYESTYTFERVLILARSRVASVHERASVSDLSSDLTYVLARDFAPELKPSLQQLKDELPDLQDQERFNDWLQANGKEWSKQLEAVIVKYRNIGHNWQFSDEQKELLQQYYDANKLLIDCLNSGCVVSDRVREEIEETLLLPIAEIQNRRGTRAEL